MPAVHGKKTVLKLDTIGNVLTDISNKCKNVDFPQEAELLETTTFQATAKTYIVGFKDNKISVQGNWDAALDAHLNAILGASEPTGQPASEGFDFEYGPEGSTTGSTKYTGKCLLVKFQKNSAVSAVSMFTAELQVTGDALRSSYA